MKKYIKRMAKCKYILIAGILLLSFLYFPFASAAPEDFTLWTEVDNANDCITVHNATYVTINATRDDGVYLYKDYGSNFSDFSASLSAKLNDFNDATYSVAGIFMVSPVTGDLNSARYNKSVSVVFKGSNLRMQHHNSSTGTYDYVEHAINAGTWYYLNITKSGNTVTLYCYNDSARTDLYFTLSLYLYQPASSYRYIETAVGTTIGGTEWANATIASLEFNASAPANSAPVISNPNPADGATGVSVSLTQLSVDIADPDGDTFNWSIETAPNIGSASGNNDVNGTKTCAISGLAYGTTYTWYVNVTDANGATSTATYTFTTEYDTSSIPSSGQPVTKSDFLQWNGVDITMKYDILNDVANMTVVTSASDSFVGTGWHAVGAPSICKSPVNDTYYITVRERHNDSVRGLYFDLYKSTDLQNWQLVWRASRQDVVNPPATVYSIERSCLRYLNGTYYFYFTAAVGETYDWKIYYVKASTPEQIDDVWLNGANWNQILTSYYRAKDPWVGYDGNKYFLFAGTSSTSSSNGIDIFIDDNPEFTSPTQVMKYTDNSHSNTGCIFFDNVSSNDFIAWTGNINDETGTVYWYFFNSSDGTAWNLADTKDTGSDNVAGTGNRRYMDYYSVAWNKTILVMEWDYDDDGNMETVLWNYAITSTNNTNETNNPPNAPSNPSPADGETNVSITTDLSWQCSDPDGDALTYDVYFGTSSTPPKVASNISSTTYDPGTLQYSTTYYWKIVAWDSNGASTSSPVWSFTTVANGSTSNQPPTADFSYTVDNLTVTFTDLSSDPDGTIVSWLWDFGDGNTSTEQNPTHTYAAYGKYNVTLTVTDSDGATDTITKQITVSDLLQKVREINDILYAVIPAFIILGFIAAIVGWLKRRK